MREILFRGKTLESGRWIDGDLRQWSSGNVGICDRATNRTYKVDPDTVGQYTGLRDNAGKPIVEGDIVRAVLPATYAFPEFVWPMMAVSFRDGAFGLFKPKCEFLFLGAFSPRVEFEVIGNIHDNPELMEVNNAAD